MENFEHLAMGVIVYKNALKKENNYIERLEATIEKSTKHSWQKSGTGYSNFDLNYRDSYDFKIRVNEDNSMTLGKTAFPTSELDDEEKEFYKIWQDAYKDQQECVEHYRSIYNIAPLQYWESFNFVKYNPGQHFRHHSDHGYSYTCVLSIVGYLNDDYEGGELSFDKLGLTIKPEAGDIILFPSSYVYSHAAMPVKSGTKYALVTMLDYLQTAHTPEYQVLEKKYSRDLL